MTNTERETEPKGWTTTDELRYLRSLPARDGGRMAAHRGAAVDARLILESWIATCRSRYWPVAVDVAQCHDVAVELLEGME